MKCMRISHFFIKGMRNHSGEVSFPGGVCDDEDQGDCIRTALRETCEELGLPQLIPVSENILMPLHAHHEVLSKSKIIGRL
jgi:8-oxo-dGTP pyrophosphatase MutT (NUDIX family)